MNNMGDSDSDDDDNDEDSDGEEVQDGEEEEDGEQEGEYYEEEEEEPQLSEEEIKQIINSYTAFRFEAKSQEDTTCAICMETLKTGEMVKSLQCSHKFHSKCINNWLLQKLQCPLCK